MPIFSLPSEFGIGGFGKECFDFVDYLEKAGQKVWQVLPLVQTGYGNSPYSSVASKSINPYFISPLVLLDEGLISNEDLKFIRYDGKYIDYGFLYQTRYPMLKKAYSNFDKNDVEFTKFVKSKKARDYALFMAIKYQSGQKHFYEWDNDLSHRDKKALDDFYLNFHDEVTFWEFLQFEGERQWKKVKEYANSKGILIMGDMPLYVALDSVDVWCNPKLFKLDENFQPKKKAGVPPDYFSADGQLWGNPVYDYEVHKKDGFSWWVNRLKDILSNFDMVRIDHFRGLDRYYEVDKDSKTARVGEWIKVPSDELFLAINKKIKKEKIVAEDLGIIDDGVRDLLKKTGYPGMRVLSFAFNGEDKNPYLPHIVEENSICYTGTHDNDTLVGLYNGFNDWDRNNFVWGIKKSLEKFGLDFSIEEVKENAIDLTVKLGFMCKSKLFIMPFSDVIKSGSEYRINEPGTIKEQNWAVRFTKEQFSNQSIKYLKDLCREYHR